MGTVTPTYDLESEPVDHKPFEHLSPETIQEATKPFTGPILQTPPIHSAIKKDGKRVYELARKGIEVKLEPRPVTIHSFEITGVQLPHVHFKVVCSTGTYIRSLANDFGAQLGCGGYLSLLCRTRIGEFKLTEAKSIEAWEGEIRNVLKTGM